MHYLYKITNLVNDKVYIGQAKDHNQRWRQHKLEAKRIQPRMVINAAMKKYGIDNFDYQIIACCKTQDDANEIETLLVKQYESHISTGKGYNVSNGGMNAPKTEEWKRHMRDLWTDPDYKSHMVKVFVEAYRSHSPEEKAKTAQLISEAHAGKHLSPNTEFKGGHQHNPEVLKQISESKMGQPSWNKGTIGIMKANQTSFQPGHSSWMKGTHITNSGSFSVGSKHKGAKLNEEQVLKIVELNKQGMKKQEIADMFGVKLDAVYGITRGRNWSHITGIKSK